MSFSRKLARIFDALGRRSFPAGSLGTLGCVLEGLRVYDSASLTHAILPFRRHCCNVDNHFNEYLRADARRSEAKNLTNY